MSKGNSPLPTRRRFSQRLSSGVGGNERSGPFHEFPLSRASYASNYFEVFNDFTGKGDFDVSTFEWNRTDGSASAYAAGTAIARIPDWVPAEVGASSLAIDPSLTSVFLRNDVPYGLLRVDAGTTDSTGNRVTRSPSGTNVANLMRLTARPTTYGTTAALRSPSGNLAYGARFAVTETGTATQSAIQVGLQRDEAATITTAGAQAGAVGHFGFFKALGSNVVQGYLRNTTSSLTDIGTLTPGTMCIAELVLSLHTTAEAVVDFYFNGVYSASIKTTGSGPTPAADAYAPFFDCINGVGADCVLDIDYYYGLSERY